MIGVLGNRYEVIEKIGEGGMSEVYKAKCKLLNRFVAIKVLKPEFAKDAEFVEKFKREAAAAAALSCNNIVSIYDVSTEENVNYIVMELVQGQTLKQIITGRGALSFNESVDISIQISRALECAHKNNIIHRDIKPQNILVTEDGIVKVTDFGIAKAVNSSTITNTTKIMGSAHYFSPEQAKGNYLDFRTDIYSFGIVLYEMVTGKVPYDADSVVSVALKHIQETVVPPINLNDKIPNSLNKLILKCIEKEPFRRYQSIKEVLADLQMIQCNCNYDIHTNKEEEDYTRIMDPITEKTINDAANLQNSNKKSSMKESNEDDDDEDYDDDDEGFGIKNKKLAVGAIVGGIVLTLLVAIIIAVKVFSPSTAGKKELAVPYLINLNKTEAEEKLKVLGLSYKEILEENDKLKDIVFKTEPESGFKIDSKDEVKVYISSGKLIVLKDCTDMTLDQAKDVLKSDGLTLVEAKEEFNDNVDKGKIMSQNPEAGAKVDKAAQINFIVSKGSQENKSKLARVPSIVNFSIRDASSLLQTAKLTIGNQTIIYTDNKALDGKIQDQKIYSGAEVKEGTPINVNVYKFDPSEVKKR